LELQVKHKNLHLLLCILLAGDVATNPGPTSDSQSRDGFKILYLNARSLKAFVHPPGNTSPKVFKISLFQDLVYSGNYDVVCVCETWLNNSVLSSEIIPNYGTVFRRDRTGRIGGGVLVAIKSGIQVTRRHDLETDNTELIVTELFKSNSKPVILYTFYRPPDSTPDVLQSLNNSLQRNQESSRIVMIGHFNLPSVK
jgi:exonuclease III